MGPVKLHVTAGEPSGDLLAREVIDALRQLEPNVDIVGIGGSDMEAAGVRSDIDIAPLAVLGFIEGLRAYPNVVRLADAAAEHIVSHNPDAAILVDSWGFTLRVAQRVRKRAPHIRLIKLVGPQVWATRPGRARTLASSVDHLLCIHAFEAPYYAPFGLKTTTIGNPAISRMEPASGDTFRDRMGYAAKDRVVLVLPGSRTSEIERVAPVLMAAASRLRADQPHVRIVAAPASNVRSIFNTRIPSTAFDYDLLPDDVSRYAAMAGASVALACSGTVTTEAAMQGAPVIVGYRLGWLSWAIARAGLLQSRYIALVNVAADAEIMPEYVQTRLKPALIAAEAQKVLADPSERARRIDQQNTALKEMGAGGPPAADRAAAAILADLSAR